MSLIDQTVSSQNKSLWHQREFLLLWIASSTGYLTRLVVRLALPLVDIRLTTSPLLVSGVTFALAVPWLLFRLPAGMLADRRHVLLWASALGLGVCVLLAGAALLGLLSLPALYATALLLGISETLTEAAMTAFTPLLISHCQLEQANMRLLGVQKEARLLVLHLLGKQVERKDVSW